MTKHEKINAGNLDAAAWRARWDMGLAWVLGPGAFDAGSFLDAGALILRRWTGQKYPQPEAGAAVGFALRPATRVASDDSADYLSDAVYWHLVDVASAGGVLAPRMEHTAQPAVMNLLSNVLVPNPPADLAVEQTTGGTAMLSWRYMEEAQQAAPTHFDVFTDQGSGLISSTPYATVSYVAGQRLYAWESGGGVADNWLWIVLADAGSAQYSLTPRPLGGSEYGGGATIGASDTYLDLSAELAVRLRERSSPPATPKAPVFA